MRYRLIDFRYEAFKPGKPNSIQELVVTRLDPVKRVEEQRHKPSAYFWYAPESIPVKEAVDMFIESEITRLQEEIKHKQDLIEQMLQAKARVVLPED